MPDRLIEAMFRDVETAPDYLGDIPTSMPPLSPELTLPPREQVPWWELMLKGAISPQYQPPEYDPNMVATPPPRASFREILFSAQLDEARKLQLIADWYPERLAEAIEIISTYDLPSGVSPLKEELEEYLVPEEGEEDFAPPPFPTDPPPEGYVWDLNELNQWVPEYVGAEAVANFGEEPEGRFYTDDAGNLHQVGYVLTSRGWDQQDTIVQFAQREALPSPISEYQEQLLSLQQQQLTQAPQWRPGELELQQQELEQQAGFYAWQQGEAERAERARLAASPLSWLQYASYTGETPAIQPWMIPLMGQQYAGTVAGAPIPGWQGDAPSLQDLPQLTRPSRQYQARIGPTALQQYQGYQQARTGATPQETDWRLYSAAPPGGTYRGLSYAR